jgi:transcriptional regulator with XRE-family HTH domain
MKKSPNPVDRHVGSRVRLRRVLIGMSQEKLGEAVDLTFQQIQKYEKGTNRIGASRIQQIAKVLEVPVSYFFEGAPVDDDAATVGGFAERDPGAGYVADFLSTAEGIQLVRAFVRIRDVKVRKRIVDLVEAMASDQST